MRWWEWLLPWKWVEAVEARERQRARQYAWLALATWRRHRRGDEVEGPESMMEAAWFIVEEDRKAGLPVDHPQTQAARDVIRELLGYGEDG